MENGTNNTRTNNTNQTGMSRSQRVAPSMRTGSSRVRSVDMSQVETPSRYGSRYSQSRSSSSDLNNVSRRSSASSSAPKSRQSSSALRTQSTSSRPARTSAEQDRSVKLSDTATIERSSTAANRNYTDILEERRARKQAEASGTASVSKPQASKKSKTSKKKGFAGIGKFWKFLIIYGAALIIIIIIIAIILSSYLKNYESKQPIHVAESVVEYFKSTDKLKKFFEDNSDIVKLNDSVLDFDENYYSGIEGKEISYISDSSRSTNDITYYNITADGDPVASIELTKNSKEQWDLTAVDTSNAFSDIKAYSILVPDGSKVTVNGIELSENCITGTGIPEILKYSSQYIPSVPEFTTYTVKLADGGVPQVSGTDASGAKLDFSATDNSFVAGSDATPEFVEHVKGRVETAISEYALYFFYQKFDLASYMYPGTEVYVSIFGDETHDRIDPWLYMWENVTGTSFNELSADHFIRYGEDCFTVDVKYDLVINLDAYADDGDDMNATWVWVWNTQANAWQISDIILH